MNARVPARVAWVLGIATSACAPPAPPPVRNAAASATAPAGAPAEAGAALVGRWEGGMAGGIGAARTEEFTADGHYTMEGYPSIGERSRYVVLSRQGNAVEVRLMNRTTCGPCQNVPQYDARPDVVRRLELASGDGAYVEGSWKMHRAPARMR